MSAWMLAVTLVGAGAVLRLEGDGQTTGASKKWARPPARLARKSSPYDYWRVLFITHSSKNCNNKKKRTVDHTHAFTFASLLSLVEDSVILLFRLGVTPTTRSLRTWSMCVPRACCILFFLALLMLTYLFFCLLFLPFFDFDLDIVCFPPVFFFWVLCCLLGFGFCCDSFSTW